MQLPPILFSTSCCTALPAERPVTHPQLPVPVPPTDARKSPEVGSLAWLLAYGLDREQLHHHTTALVGHPGQAVQLPPVAHAQPPLQKNCFSAPVAAPEPSLRDDARMTLAGRLRDDFKDRLDVVPARPDTTPAKRWAALQKSMATAYLLGLPVSSDVAKRLNRVEQWTPQEVFGCSANQLVALLRRLRTDTLAELALHKIPPGAVRNEVIQAAGDFWAYVDECIENVGEMRRTDGSRPRQLSPDTLARLRFFVDSLV